ncbi:MAG: NAD-dependent epimerase/dehydratase family protein [Pseudomonadota bacterium]
MGASIITGCGQVGRQLCDLLAVQNKTITCLVKTQASRDLLTQRGFTAKTFDLDTRPTLPEDLPLAQSDLYYFIPPSNTDLIDHRIDYFLELCKTHIPRRIVYISTSGVYGDCNGEWVNEAHPASPVTERAKRRYYAELSLIQFCKEFQCQFNILRVGGIYGPERLPLERLKTVTVVCPEEAPYSNRIHAYDLASACLAAMHCDTHGEIINVADGHPTSMTDYFYQLADMAELPHPPCVPLSQAEEKLSPGMLSFINESRRLSIDKMQSVLKIALKFPTLEQGLKDCFKSKAKDL